MPYPLDPYLMLPIEKKEQPLPTAEELHAALIDAVWAKQTDKVRTTLDQAFVQGIELLPTGAMLYLAAANNDIDTCRLLRAYGATWSPDEAHIFWSLLNDAKPETLHFLRRLKPRDGLLHNELDQLRALSGLLDILNRHTYTDQYKALGKYFYDFSNQIAENAIAKNDFRYVKEICNHVSRLSLNLALLFSERKDIPQHEMLNLIRSLQKNDVPIQMLDLADPDYNSALLEKLSYIEPLHKLGLLDRNQSGFRETLISVYEKILSDQDLPAAQRIYKSDHIQLLLKIPRVIHILFSPHYRRGTIPETEAEIKKYMHRKNMPPQILDILLNSGFTQFYPCSPSLSAEQKKKAPHLSEKFNYFADLYQAHRNACDWDSFPDNALSARIHRYELLNNYKYHDIEKPGQNAPEYKFAVARQYDKKPEIKRSRGTSSAGPC